MSKQINYLDLIKNPEKIGGLENNRTSKPYKEAVIPKDLNGVKKNEWQESQAQQQALEKRSKSSEGIIRFSNNPPQNNQEKKVQQSQGSNQIPTSKAKSIDQQVHKIPLKNNVAENKISKSSSIKKQPSQKNENDPPQLSRQEILRAKYSLKKESKEDYKKIFKEVVKEYKDEENYYYDGNKVKKSTLFIYLLLILITVMGYFDVVATNTPRFCSTKFQADQPRCLKCPENAKCSKSIMKCDNGYIQKDYACTLNPNLINSANGFILEKIFNLQIENGNRLCFEEEEDLVIKSAVPLDLMVEELNQRIADKSTAVSQSNYLIEFLEKEENKKIHSFSYNKDRKEMSSERVRFTVFCSAKVFLKSNWKTLVFWCVVASLFMGIFSYVRKSMRKDTISSEIYEDLLSQLEQSGDKSINISYCKEGIIKKYKSEFDEDVWVQVDHLRFQDKKISIYRDIDGLYWSLI